MNSTSIYNSYLDKSAALLYEAAFNKSSSEGLGILYFFAVFRQQDYKKMFTVSFEM